MLNMMRTAAHAILMCALLANRGTSEPSLLNTMETDTSDNDSRSLLEDWEIQPIGISVKFRDGESKVDLEYNISNLGEPYVYLHPAPYQNIFGGNKTCQKNETADNLSYNKTVTNVSDTVDNMLVSINLNMTDMETANIYSAVNSTFGYISFCAFVELVLHDATGNISINFNEQIVELTSNKYADNIPDDEGPGEESASDSNGYTVQVAKDGRRPLEQEVTLNADVIACICDDNNGCISPTPTLRQNSVLKLCLEAEGSGFEIDRLVFLNLNQGGMTKRSPVTDGVNDALTDLADYVGQDGKAGKSVSTRLTTYFFETSNPPPINVVGEADLAFSSSRRMRVLLDETSSVGGGEHYERRREKQEEIHSYFGLTVELASDEANADDAEADAGDDREEVPEDATITDTNTVKEEDTGSGGLGMTTLIMIIAGSAVVVVLALMVYFDALGRTRKALPSLMKDLKAGSTKK